jgi:foldase protein PrsA
MNVRKVISALGAFFVLAAGLSACGSGVPGNSVAVMAGNPVTLQTFNHWMFVAAKGQAAQSPGSPVIVPTDPPQFASCIAQVRKQIPSLAKSPASTIKNDCTQLFQSLANQVLDFLIKAYWYQADAHKLKIFVTDAQVQKAYQTAKKQEFPTDTQFQAFLKQTGQTLPDILFRVRINQIFMKLLARYSKPVTAAQVQTYYSAHLTQFGTPETRDLNQIRTKTASEANAAKAALSKGQSWTKAAKKYSVDTATNKKGGALKGVTKGQEEAPFDKAIFAAKANKLVGPVKGQFGYYVFEVSKIHTATQQSLAKATPQIKQLLTSQQQSSAQTKVDGAAKKSWLSKTTCRDFYWIQTDCKGPKPKNALTTTTTPTTPTPTPTPTTPGSSTSPGGTATSTVTSAPPTTSTPTTTTK